MTVPGVIFATEALIRDMDDKVMEQASNVAMLPGIVGASYVMPGGHWGYGFPIGVLLLDRFVWFEADIGGPGINDPTTLEGTSWKRRLWSSTRNC